MSSSVGVAEIARGLNLTERRVMQLVREGMPKLERGRYDTVTCLEWYVRYLQAAIERRSSNDEDGKPSSWQEEKKRLTAAQANIAELEYRQKIGELIPAHLVDDKFVTFAGNVHDRFLALPSRLAPRLENVTREVVRQKLYDAIKDLLNGLSNDLGGAKDGDEKATPKRNQRKTGKGRRARSAKVRSRA